jgi:ion channel-forming bestrophin family protein
MIVRPKINWWRMLFVWNGSVLKPIIPQLLFLLVVDLLALLSDGRILGKKVPLDTAPFTLVGVSLAIFLAFRNNASYDRHWEARKLWGHLLIASRSLASQAIAYLPARAAGGGRGNVERAGFDHVDSDRAGFDRDYFIARLVAVAYTLKHALRDSDAGADLARLLPGGDVAALAEKRYQPMALVHSLRCTLGDLAAAQVEGNRLWLLDQQLNELSMAIGSCERIATTPIPFPYGVLLHRTVYVYCILLPFGLVDSIGIATPAISLFVSYTLLALEAIASELAEPFGMEPNNLALDAITRGIERSLLELNGVTLPPSVETGQRYIIS